MNLFIYQPLKQQKLLWLTKISCQTSKRWITKRFRPAMQAWFAERPAPVAEKQYTPLLEVHGLTYSLRRRKECTRGCRLRLARVSLFQYSVKTDRVSPPLPRLLWVIDVDSGLHTPMVKTCLSFRSWKKLLKSRCGHIKPESYDPHHMILMKLLSVFVTVVLQKNWSTEKVENVLELCGLSKFRHWPIEALSYGQKACDDRLYLGVGTWAWS